MSSSKTRLFPEPITVKIGSTEYIFDESRGNVIINQQYIKQFVRTIGGGLIIYKTKGEAIEGKTYDVGSEIVKKYDDVVFEREVLDVEHATTAPTDED